MSAKNILEEVVKRIIFENNIIIAFQWGVADNDTNISEIEK